MPKKLLIIRQRMSMESFFLAFTLYMNFLLLLFFLNTLSICYICMKTKVNGLPAQGEGDTLGQTESSSLLAEVELLHHQSPCTKNKSIY